MESNNTNGEESSDARVIEDISQIKHIALGEEAGICVVCGSKLREGSALIAYAFRPADAAGFEIGHVKCRKHTEHRVECFTLGVRELVVEGRVGRCSDVATQSSWPVLLNPSVLVVSEAASRTGTEVGRRQPANSDEIDQGPNPESAQGTSPNSDVSDSQTSLPDALHAESQRSLPESQIDQQTRAQQSETTSRRDDPGTASAPREQRLIGKDDPVPSTMTGSGERS